MSDNENEKGPNQILITFNGPRSTEFEMQIADVSVSQMMLAAEWLRFKAKSVMEMAEKERQGRLASIREQKPQVLIPGMKVM